MKTANLTEVKDGLSRWVEYVRRGGRVRILVHGIPAAEIVPIADDRATEDAALTELDRQGLGRRGRNAPVDLLKPGPRVRGGRAAETVIRERRSRP